MKKLILGTMFVFLFVGCRTVSNVPVNSVEVTFKDLTEQGVVVTVWGADFEFMQVQEAVELSQSEGVRLCNLYNKSAKVAGTKKVREYNQDKFDYENFTVIMVGGQSRAAIYKRDVFDIHYVCS